MILVIGFVVIVLMMYYYLYNFVCLIGMFDYVSGGCVVWNVVMLLVGEENFGDVVLFDLE